MVKFNEEKHLYQNLEGENYISCSTIVGLFENKFDRKFWGIYKALEEHYGTDTFKKVKFKYLKKKDEDSILQLVDTSIYEKILDLRQKYYKQWDDENLKSRIKGNKLHLQKEHKALKDKFVLFEGKHYDTIDFKSTYIDKNLEELQTLNYYTDLPDGYYPELLIFNHDLKIAGTSDRVFLITKDGVRYAIIDDFKSNKKINTENKYEKMLYPLNHLDDCNKSHYEVQISLYGFLLELMGFRVLHTRFTHIDDNHIETPYIVDYSARRIDIQHMINEFKEVYPFCKEYFKQLITNDRILRIVISDWIKNTEINLSNEIGDFKFHEDKLKDNIIKYIVKDFILNKRNELKI